jgi:taurine dioxygenase
MRDSTLKASRLSGPFGVQVHRSLEQPLTPSDETALRSLFRDHQLLVFRDQAALSRAQQERVAGLLGPIIDPSEDIAVVSTDSTIGALGTAPLAFHSDLSFIPETALALSLYAVDLTDDISSTRFASNLRAYRQMPQQMRDRVSALRVTHRLGYVPSGMQRSVQDPEIATAPSTTRSGIIPHPTTGAPLLFVEEGHLAGLTGIPDEEIDELLIDVNRIQYGPDNVYEHVWRRGDLLIWDNVALQHARADMSGVGRRILQRVTVGTSTLTQSHPELRAKIAEALKSY